MRAWAMMFLFLLPGICDAQQASLASCIERLAGDTRFALIAGKLAVGAVTGVTPAMITDNSLADGREREVIADWASARAECVKADSRYGNATYRPPLQSFGMDAENKIMAAAVELYDGKISFGEFNRRRQLIAEELRAKSADLSRQIQSQRSAQEQSDRQAREREQMQREIEETQRQASNALQQAVQAKEGAARLSVRPDRQDRSLRSHPALIVPYRNCYRFGGRVACMDR